MTTAAPIYVNPSGPGFKEFLSSDTISVPGTIALPTFTTGSVIFAGALGVLAQDNANLFWNDASNQLKVGTPAVVATQAVGFLLTNPTLSTNPVPEQYSPMLVQQGHAWSNALGVDKVIEFATQVETIESGVGLATGNLYWRYQYDSAGWSDIAFMDATGRLSVSALAVSTFTAGSIPFVKVAAIGDPPGLLIENNANLFWNNTLNRLGIGVAIPLNTLHVVGDLRVTAALGVYPYVSGVAALVPYEVVYAYDSGGTSYFNKAINTAESTSRVVGVVVTGATNIGDPFTLVTAGIYKMKFTGGNPVAADYGKPVYLSAVAGSVTLTAPVAAGSVVIRVGYLVGYGAADSNVAIHIGDTFVI